MSQIVVTGANGYVGGRIVEGLRHAGYAVRGLRRGGGRTDPADGLVPVDYSRTAELRAAFEGARAVVHVAGLAHVSISSPAAALDAYRAANVELVGQVALAAHSAGVSRVIMVSSAGVYGGVSPPGGFVDDSPPAPHDAYTRSKLDGEFALLQVGRETGLEVTILRPPMIYGNGAPGSYERMCRWMDSGWPLPLGGIRTRRSLVGIHNFVSAVRAALEGPPCGAKPVIVADEGALSVAEFARELARARRSTGRIFAVPPGMLAAGLALLGRGADYRRLFGDFELRGTVARDVLGWTPPHSVRDELEWPSRLGAA